MKLLSWICALLFLISCGEDKNIPVVIPPDPPIISDGILTISFEGVNNVDMQTIKGITVWLFDSNQMLKEIAQLSSVADLQNRQWKLTSGTYSVITATNIQGDITHNGIVGSTTASALAIEVRSGVVALNQSIEMILSGRTTAAIESGKEGHCTIKLSPITKKIEGQINDIATDVIHTKIEVVNMTSTYNILSGTSSSERVPITITSGSHEAGVLSLQNAFILPVATATKSELPTAIIRVTATTSSGKSLFKTEKNLSENGILMDISMTDMAPLTPDDEYYISEDTPGELLSGLVLKAGTNLNYDEFVSVKNLKVWLFKDERLVEWISFSSLDHCNAYKWSIAEGSYRIVVASAIARQNIADNTAIGMASSELKVWHTSNSSIDYPIYISNKTISTTQSVWTDCDLPLTPLTATLNFSLVDIPEGIDNLQIKLINSAQGAYLQPLALLANAASSLLYEGTPTDRTIRFVLPILPTITTSEKAQFVISILEKGLTKNYYAICEPLKIGATYTISFSFTNLLSDASLDINKINGWHELQYDFTGTVK